MESLKSIEQAAEVLALSPWTVRAYVRQGKIRPVRIGPAGAARGIGAAAHC